MKETKSICETIGESVCWATRSKCSQELSSIDYLIPDKGACVKIKLDFESDEAASITPPYGHPQFPFFFIRYTQTLEAELTLMTFDLVHYR